VNDKTEIALKSDKALHHEDVCGVLLISTLNGSSFHVPAALFRGKIPGTNLIGWELWRREKSVTATEI